jgi:hypothetical protein
MDLKRLITHFTYRIEPKPEGGFIAHPSDPAVPPLEAATREELQQKIQANIATALAAEFPGLKLPLENRELKYSFHVELKPGGGFAIHSADPNAKQIQGATHEEIENQFLEKLLGFVGKHFTPELAQALAAQGNAGDIKIFVNRKMGATTPAEGSLQLNDTKIKDWKLVNAKTASGDFSNVEIANAPITPEASGSWSIFRFLLALLIIAAVMYFFFYHH